MQSETKEILATAKPLGDRVIVLRDLANTETPGGIVLPESVVSRAQQVGVVVAIGPGVNDTGNIKVGARVAVSGYAGLEITDPAVVSTASRYVILREEDVLAVL